MTIVNLDPTNLEFSVFTTEDIRKISVTKITLPRSFNELGQGLRGGLYDSCMGSSGFGEICGTCSRDSSRCEGHFGHIELDLPVYNPFFVRHVFSMLRITCMSCVRIQMRDGLKSLLELQLRLADAGYIVEAEELELYKTKLRQYGTDEIPEEVSAYEDLLLKEPYNKLGDTKLSSAIRTAIVNNTLKECTVKKCIHCKKLMTKFLMSDGKITIRWTQGDKKLYYEAKEIVDPTDEQLKAFNEALLARECMLQFRKLYETEGSVLKLLVPMLGQHAARPYPTDIFFMEAIPVPPPKTRPERRLAKGSVVEHPQSLILRNILLANSTVRAILMSVEEKQSDESVPKEDRSSSKLTTVQEIVTIAKGASLQEKLFHAWCALQTAVNQLLDVNESAKGSKAAFSLKRLVEKKEGLIRKHMMGKRVNHAARTVITPDPNIGVEEIGIPMRFAKKLTYPVPVTPWNVSELRQWVLNGPDVYPGANMIEDSNGRQSKISAFNVTHRQSMAKTLLTPHGTATDGDSIKIVHRHLQDGDILLLNRQPTLHRPSIMAHRAKILSGEKIFRLHYSNCKSYNADFDGDEMNAHLPQNEVARSEAYGLVAVPYQYLVPKDGTPLGGLIQDHIVSAVKLFIRGKFFNREDYQQLTFQALSNKKGNIELLPPSILKPVRLWSGKQIISTLIKNSTPKGLPHINMVGKSKLSNKHWCIHPARPWQYGGTPLGDGEMSESEVHIRAGELLCGILDKNHFGATPYGLIHCMYELYGGVCSTALLSSLSRLFTYYLQWEGFTLGVKDILVQEKADRKRAKIIRECRATAGHEATAAALELPPTVSSEELSKKMAEAYAKNPKFRAILDRKYKSVLDTYTNRINNTCLPEGLISHFPENNLQLMVQSGAKGSTVNTMQISCLLGQIELEGKRPPLMLSGRSLPSFAHFETSPKSGGFIDGRFMTGIQPQDFFFHCMAGREGLIDTAVKTSRSGYLQRCLVKHLEGLSVHYDMTVRDSDGGIVQFMFGEDGMDITKVQFVGNVKQTRFLDQNRDVFVRKEVMERLTAATEEDPLNDALRKHLKKIKRWKKHNGGSLVQKQRISPFAAFSAEHADALRQELSKPDKLHIETGRTRLTEKLIKRWRKLDPAEKRQYVKRTSHCPDPAAAVYRPDAHYGVISERLEQLVSEYKRGQQPLHDIDELMQLKASTSLVAPGEPVGVLAAQSIGEPSTQMTLNTFHFAGRGEMNVTLGIPRLREILMTATEKIMTPSLEIPFRPHKRPERLAAVADKLRRTLNRVTVADVLESVTVNSKLVLQPTRCMQHTIRFKFLPPDAYSHDYRVTPKEIVSSMSRAFFRILFSHMRRAEQAKNVLLEEDSSGKKRPDGQDEEDDAADQYEPEAGTAGRKENRASDSESDDEDPAMNNDADATESKMRGKKTDDVGYDDEDEASENGEKKKAKGADSGDSSSSDTDESDADGEEVAPVGRKTKPEEADVVNEQDEQAIGQTILGTHASTVSKELHESEELRQLRLLNERVTGYTFDKENYHWCQLVLQISLKAKDVDLAKVIRDAAAQCVVWEVPKIKRAITYTQNDQLYLKTDGINIPAMAKYAKLLDVNRLYTNDIHAMAKRYGIEAASRVIVKEIQNVFSVYGITIDPRHLLLVADYMTASGRYTAMNRMGMVDASPLQQLSFESSITFLKRAMLKAQNDPLESPSARLMVGQPCKLGTGAFTLYSSALKDFAKSNPSG
ncbi:hypothetical protein ZHAS_00013038 [Anopheles sinensis]|uniref:DNA-directed RNA polymerase subunit n=1 Tax=Anopheles sinensis TaxID=74873 RepID=A0A084W4H3_ANOSI|nr:hypothetical protein ZHAS_00013038 [Anopheles sinensis]